MRRCHGRKKRLAYHAESQYMIVESKSIRKIIFCHNLYLYCRNINDGIAELDQDMLLGRILVNSMNHEMAKTQRDLHLAIKEVRFFLRQLLSPCVV